MSYFYGWGTTHLLKSVFHLPAKENIRPSMVLVTGVCCINLDCAIVIHIPAPGVGIFSPCGGWGFDYWCGIRSFKGMEEFCSPTGENDWIDFIWLGINLHS